MYIGDYEYPEHSISPAREHMLLVSRFCMDDLADRLMRCMPSWYWKSTWGMRWRICSMVAANLMNEARDAGKLVHVPSTTEKAYWRHVDAKPIPGYERSTYKAKAYARGSRAPSSYTRGNRR